MKKGLLFLFLFLTVFSFGQQVEDITYFYSKGKRYLIHYAQDGNTLYGIKTQYKVLEKDLIAANPGIEKGVKEGARYLIPAGDADIKVADGSMVLHHSILKGETAYSLCKKYGITIEQFNSLNPEAQKGLKLGQIVKVLLPNTPVNNNSTTTSTSTTQKEVEAPKIIYSDSTISYTVKAKETIYTIAKRYMVPAADLQKFNNLKSTKIKEGDVLQIPLKKEKVEKVEIREVKPIDKVVEPKVDQTLLFKKKEKYQIALLLPFGLSDPNSPVKTLSTEFYMGAKLALDSLERKGLDAYVQVFDFTQDTSEMKAFMDAKLKGMDLIIGPLIPSSTEIVAKWCMKNKIRMVCPATVKPSVLVGNQFVYAAVPSDEMQQRALAKYTVRSQKQKTIVLINTGVAKSKYLYDAYRDAFIEESKKGSNIKLIEAKLSDYSAFIKKNGNTVLVFPSDDKAVTMKFLNEVFKIKNKAGSGTITVLGTKDWSNFDDITGNMKNELNITWASSSDLNYKREETKNLLRTYRREYKADLNKYGAHGYDIVSYFISYILMDEVTTYSCMNNFHIEQIEPGSGFENKGVIILQNKDYELIRVAEIDE